MTERYVTLMNVMLKSSLMKKKKKFLDILGKSPLGGESLELYSHGTSFKPRNLSDDKVKGATKKRGM